MQVRGQLGLEATDNLVESEFDHIDNIPRFGVLPDLKNFS